MLADDTVDASIVARFTASRNPNTPGTAAPNSRDSLWSCVAVNFWLLFGSPSVVGIRCWKFFFALDFAWLGVLTAPDGRPRYCSEKVSVGRVPYPRNELPRRIVSRRGHHDADRGSRVPESGLSRRLSTDLPRRATAPTISC